VSYAGGATTEEKKGKRGLSPDGGGGLRNLERIEGEYADGDQRRGLEAAMVAIYGGKIKDDRAGTTDHEQRGGKKPPFNLQKLTRVAAENGSLAKSSLVPFEKDRSMTDNQRGLPESEAKKDRVLLGRCGACRPKLVRKRKELETFVLGRGEKELARTAFATRGCVRFLGRKPVRHRG